MKQYRVSQLENEHGDLHQVIPQLVNTYGCVHTAVKLGASPATINRWLKKNGYALKKQWAKTQHQEGSAA